MSLPNIPHDELKNIRCNIGRLCLIDIVTLMLRIHVKVCNGNTRVNPIHVLVLNYYLIATIIIISITHVIM
jgi:hypothetical protein